MINKIVKKPGRYDIDTALRLVAQSFESDDFKNIGRNKVCINSTKELGFLGSSLVDFKIIDGPKILGTSLDQQFMIDSAILNFGGPFGPLPSMLYEEIVRNFREGREEQLKFLNLFVDRLVKLDFHFRRELSWKFGIGSGIQAPNIGFFSKFLKCGGDSLNKKVHYDYKFDVRKLKYFRPRRNASAINLKMALTSCLDMQIVIHQKQRSWLEIPKNEVCRLSSSSLKGTVLGKDSNLGSYYSNSSSKIKIVIENAETTFFESIINCNNTQKAFKNFFRDMFDKPTTVVFEMRPSEVSRLDLTNKSRKGGLKLGQSSWLYSKNDNYEMSRLFLKSH